MTQPAYAYVIVKSAQDRHVLLASHLPAFIIGSDARCQLQLHEGSVTPSHAVIHRRENSYVLIARAPTRVNGSEIRQSHTLNPGDTIQIGTAILEFRHDNLYDSSLAPQIVEFPVAPKIADPIPQFAAAPIIITPPKSSENGEHQPKIYFPQQRPKTLPGRPLWVVIYALGLCVSALILIFATLTRFNRGVIESIYGDSRIGIAILAGSIVAIVVAEGVYRMTRWGWHLARLACLGWIAISVFFSIRMFQAVTQPNQGTIIVAVILGLTTLAAVDTLIHAMSGGSLMEMAGEPASSLAGKTAINFGGRRNVAAPMAMMAVGVTGITLVVPMIVALISVFGDHFVVTALILQPEAYTSLVPLEQGLAVMILIGGITIHLLVIILLNLDRARFDKPTPLL